MEALDAGTMVVRLSGCCVELGMLVTSVAGLVVAVAAVKVLCGAPGAAVDGAEVVTFTFRVVGCADDGIGEEGSTVPIDTDAEVDATIVDVVRVRVLSKAPRYGCKVEVDVRCCCGGAGAADRGAFVADGSGERVVAGGRAGGVGGGGVADAAAAVGDGAVEGSLVVSAGVDGSGAADDVGDTGATVAGGDGIGVEGGGGCDDTTAASSEADLVERKLKVRVATIEIDCEAAVERVWCVVVADGVAVGESS